MKSFTELLLYVLTGSVVLLVVNYYWKRRRLFYHAAKIQGPFCLPIMGSSYLFAPGKKELFSIFMRLGEKYRNVPAKFWIFSELCVMVTKPEDVERVLKQYLEKGQVYKFITGGIGYGLPTAPVPIWEVHRRIINQTFNQKILNSYMNTFIERAKDVVNSFKNITFPVNVFPMLTQCSYRIMSETCMETEPPDQQTQKDVLYALTRNIELVSSRIQNPLLHNNLMWRLFGHMKEEELLNRKGFQQTEKVIAQRRKEMEEDPDCHSNIFLTQLIKSDEEGRLSERNVVEETQTMFVAGIESTATTMSFIMLVLGMHQDVQEKVYQEMLEVLGLTNRDPTPEDLNRMEYTERVIKETMRLFPVAPLLVREADRDLILADKTVVPKGSTLWVPVGFIHRDPEVYPDPLKFNPDRFLPQEVEKRHRCTYLPFSFPPRNCIGIKFAMMSLKVMLAEILRNFKIASCQYKTIEEVELSVAILLSATNGYGITLEPRL